LQEAHEATGIGALGFDLGSVIAYLVTFLLLVVILSAFAYKPVLAMLDKRANSIKESLEQAERVRRESEQRQAEMQRSLDESRAEAQRMLVEAQAAAERYRQQQAEQARVEGQALIERAREEIQRERNAAIEQVRREFAGLAVTAAERIIHKSLDTQTHRQLIDEVLADGGRPGSRG
jgi:F-type H+-transporting ATPase subunit b